MGEHGCRLILTQSIEFDRELSEDEYGMEAMMLTFAGFSALAKIKLHAEQGVEAVRAMSGGAEWRDWTVSTVWIDARQNKEPRHIYPARLRQIRFFRT